MATTIEEFVKERGIVSLYHFTRVENLPSILKKGLQKRDHLEFCRDVLDDSFIFNDSHRFDNTNAICTSISFPNYKMFYRLRCNDATAEWVVIEIYAAVLWLKKCAFCVTNAADAAVTAVPIDQRQSLDALKRLFDDFGGKTRESLAIPNRYPTNPQAEVLVSPSIEHNLIRKVYFQKPATLQQFGRDYPIIDYALNGGYFEPRSDWRHWQQHG